MMNRILPLLLILGLMAGGGGISADEANGSGTSSLYEAVWNEKPALARRLLMDGAAPNFRTANPNPNKSGKNPLHAAIKVESPAMTVMLLEFRADPHASVYNSKTKHESSLLLEAVWNWSANRVKQPQFTERAQEVLRLLVVAGADPTIRDGKGLAPMNHVAGYRKPGVKYTRGHSSGWLHQLMLSHVEDRSKLDDTMKWRGRGCWGYKVERGDLR